jgi:hypothetical protein
MKIIVRHFDEKGYERDLREAKLSLYGKRFNTDGRKVLETYGELVFPMLSRPDCTTPPDERADAEWRKIEEDAMTLVEQDNYITDVEYDYLGTALDKDGSITLIGVSEDGTLEKIRYDKDDRSVHIRIVK